MARTDNFINWATDIADSIREKTGKTDKIPASEFDTEIKSIQGSEEVSEDLTNELNTYNSELLEQDDLISTIITELTNKAAGDGPAIPEKGFVVTKWDESGYPLAIKTINLGTLDDYMFGRNTTDTSINMLTKNLKEIIVDETTTEVGTNTFANNPNLNKVSIPKVTTLSSDSTTSGSFSNNPKLQAVWIGADITSIGFYTFYQDYAMRKIFIDLPRATVETFTNYNVAFSNRTFPANLAIVCNDDTYFKTQEEFEAIDWSTYMDERTDCSNLFSGTTANKQWVLNQIPYYKPTNGFKMFYQNTNMTGEVDMTPMDVSQCTNFESMFEGWSNADAIDVSNWDTSQATNFQSMFIFCFQTDGAHLDLSSFNTEKVTNMAYMFWYTTNICILDLSSFDFTNVTNAANMFNSCGTRATTNYGAYAAGVPYIYVKDEVAQNWVLTANNAHPTTWTTANVVIKSEVTE